MKLNLSLLPRPETKEGPKTLRECILEDLEKTKYELETAYSGFDNVTDPDLIDCYIFESNAAWKRYRFLLRQAKGVSSSFGHEEAKSSSNVQFVSKSV